MRCSVSQLEGVVTWLCRRRGLRIYTGVSLYREAVRAAGRSGVQACRCDRWASCSALCDDSSRGTVTCLLHGARLCWRSRSPAARGGAALGSADRVQALASCEHRLSQGRPRCRLLQQRCGGAASCRREVSCGAGPRCVPGRSGGRGVGRGIRGQAAGGTGPCSQRLEADRGSAGGRCYCEAAGAGEMGFLGLFPALVLTGCVRG